MWTSSLGILFGVLLHEARQNHARNCMRLENMPYVILQIFSVAHARTTGPEILQSG